EGLELILAALETLRRGEAEADWSRAVREAESAVREAARLEEFPLARRGVRAALGVAARSGREELVRRAESLEEAVTAEELRWLAYRQAYQRLDLDPADP